MNWSDAVKVEDVRDVTAPFAPYVVYVYGSGARGEMRADSDIDVEIFPGIACEPYALFCAAQALAARCGREVDLVDLTRASGVLQAQVAAHGVRVIVNEVRRADEFEMYALSDYAYLNEKRGQVIEAFMRPYHE